VTGGGRSGTKYGINKLLQLTGKNNRDRLRKQETNCKNLQEEIHVNSRIWQLLEKYRGRLNFFRRNMY
jgi:hypothetical protein